LQQANKETIGGSKGGINRWKNVNKEAVDGSQQPTCGVGGNKQTRNPSVTGSKQATMLIFAFISLVIFQHVNIVISLIQH